MPEAGYPLRTLPLSGMKGVSPAARLAAAAAAGWATVRCAAWMLRSRPDLVVGAGGYASGPAVLAAMVLRIRTLVIEQNHFPGATNRWLAPRVDAVCVPSEAARERLGGRGIVTGNPVRAEFASIGPPPGRAEMSILVSGGSRGASSINRAVVGALPELGRMAPPPRIVHQTGAADERPVAEGYRGFAGPHEVRAFLGDMPRRLAEADLAVCRAGATTLAELAAAGRPAILVPYPFAADDHQRWNAEEVRAAGAATVVLDGELSGPRLAAEIRALAGDPERRRSMAAAARSLARPEAAARIADVADALLQGGAPGEERRVP